MAVKPGYQKFIMYITAKWLMQFYIVKMVWVMLSAAVNFGKVWMAVSRGFQSALQAVLTGMKNYLYPVRHSFYHILKGVTVILQMIMEVFELLMTKVNHGHNSAQVFQCSVHFCLIKTVVGVPGLIEQ